MKTKLFFASLFLVGVNLGATPISDLKESVRAGRRHAIYVHDLGRGAVVESAETHQVQHVAGFRSDGKALVIGSSVAGFAEALGPGLPMPGQIEGVGQIYLDRRILAVTINLEAQPNFGWEIGAKTSATDLVITTFQAMLERIEKDPRINFISFKVRGAEKIEFQKKLRENIRRRLKLEKAAPDWGLLKGAVVVGLWGSVAGTFLGDRSLVSGGLSALSYLGVMGWRDYVTRTREAQLGFTLPITAEMRLQLNRFGRKPGNEIPSACEAYARQQFVIDVEAVTLPSNE